MLSKLHLLHHRLLQLVAKHHDSLVLACALCQDGVWFRHLILAEFPKHAIVAENSLTLAVGLLPVSFHRLASLGQPHVKGKVHSLADVEAMRKTAVVRVGERDDKFTRTLHESIHRHIVSTQLCRAYHSREVVKQLSVALESLRDVLGQRLLESARLVGGNSVPRLGRTGVAVIDREQRVILDVEAECCEHHAEIKPRRVEALELLLDVLQHALRVVWQLPQIPRVLRLPETRSLHIHVKVVSILHHHMALVRLGEPPVHVLHRSHLLVSVRRLVLFEHHLALLHLPLRLLGFFPEILRVCAHLSRFFLELVVGCRWRAIILLRVWQTCQLIIMKHVHHACMLLLLLLVFHQISREWCGGCRDRLISKAGGGVFSSTAQICVVRRQVDDVDGGGCTRRVFYDHRWQRRCCFCQRRRRFCYHC
mmetsp:Transcript_14545/g.36426  ORF Transcript_14545/g.36426 Transcript_14545/m.36426 type:complete len:422 (+) Transcript_14545:560-1825(+)